MADLKTVMKEKVEPKIRELSQAELINGISRAFSGILPVTMIGSLITLVNYIRIGNLQETLARIGVTAAVGTIVNFTTNCISLYLVFSLGSTMARFHYDENNSKTVGILSILAFLLMTPLYDGKGITLAYLGSRGMFTAIILGIVVPKLYRFLTTKGLIIKLPESVPKIIADSFNGIIPGFIIAILCIVVNSLVGLTGAECLSDLIMTLLQKPFTMLSGSIVTKVILTMCTSFLWFFGIHGGMVIGSVTTLLFTQATMENIAAGAAGQELPNIITTGMSTLAGGTENLVAAVAILLFIKRDDMRAIAKLALVPALFNISEPIRFGLPTVLNPTMFVPAVFTSSLMDILTYIVVKIGLVSRPRIAGIFGTPVFLDAFAMGGISALIWSIVCFGIRLLIWTFFLKVYERQKNREDQEQKTAETEA